MGGMAPGNVRQQTLRRALRYRGEGDYRSFGRGLARWGGAAIGAGLGYMGGGLKGAAEGFQTGWDKGASASKYVGLGDYGPPVSNQIAGGMGSAITVNASDDLTGDVFISHSEYVGNVTASNTAAGASAFEQTTYALNPGIQQSFPFLSQLASNFEMYDFMGLMYHYRPTSGENATANSLGKVMMATQYDPDAGKWLNSVQLMNYDYSCSTKPSVELIHGVETANKQAAVNMMYVRTNSDTTKSRLFTDVGNFTVATEGIPFAAAGTQILGELWVTYRIKLSRAALYQSMLGLNQPLDTFKAVSTVVNLMPTPVGRTTNAGLWTVTSTGSNAIIVQADPRLIAGCYQWTWYCHEGTPTTTVTSFSISSLVNCAPVFQPSALSASSSLISGLKAATENTALATGFITVNNTNNVAPRFQLSIGGTASATANLLWTFVIGQVPCTIESNPFV